MVHAFIITGFLGSGKSTLLKDTVQKHFKDKKIAIVVNEFGEIGVDQNILKNVHSDVIEISDGCICCQLAEEFEVGVIEILNKYDPDILFVETAGITEPFPVFLSLQNLGIVVEGVICVCDVKNYPSYMHNSTAKYQVGGSNIIILNKTDLVTPEELYKAKQDILEYKNEYDIKNIMTGKKVFNHFFIHTSQQGVVKKEVFEGIYQVDVIVGFSRDYRHHEHAHEDGIMRYVAHNSKEITFGDIDELLSALPKNIYRVKGMIQVQDVPEPLIVNYAFGNVSYEELSGYDGKTILVFIGEKIDKEMAALVNQCEFLEILEHHSHDDHHDHHHDHQHEHHNDHSHTH